MDYVNIHVHSEFSLLDGMISPEEIINYAKENNQKAIAITDHGKMGGFFKLLKHGKEQGVKPLIGVEVYMVKDINFQQNRKKGEKEQRYHLTLIAKNKKGMQDLFQLTSKSHTEGFYYRPRVNKEMIDEFSDNLIVMTGCIAGVIPQLLINGKYKLAKKQAIEFNNNYKDFYMEMQPNSLDEQKEVNRGLVKLHNDTDIPLVATTDAHYLKEQQESHKVLLGINSGGNMWEFDDDTFHLMTGNEIFKLFKKNHPFLSDKIIRGAIKNTIGIADKCDWLENERMGDTLPNPYPELEDKEEEYEFLEELCEKGWEEKNMLDKKNLPEYQERLGRELKQIKELGFVRYFLLVNDLYENFVKPNDLMYGTGRGSSAGSLVCCLLDITTPDPIKYGLMFERFISPNRIHEPDVDMDFEDKRRGEVKEYFIEKYGREYVADIGTYGTMKGKQVLRDVSRVYGIPKNEVDKISNFIIQRSGGDARASNTIEDTFQEFDECKKFDKRYPKVLKHAKNLESRVRHAGTHAAGVIISNVKLIEHTPLEVRGGQNGNITTALDWRETDKQGFLKMDVLGLRTLSVIKDTIDQLELTKEDYEKYDIDLEFPKDKEKVPMKRKHLVHVNYNDKRVLDEFRAGDTEGVFQFNSVGMSDILKEMKVEGFEDLVSLNSLYRPGGMRCITGDTKVQKGKNGNVIYKKIKDVYDDWKSANDLGKSMKKVASLNLETGRLENTRLLNIEYSGKKEVYSLKCLHYDGVIKASENHKFLCCNKNNKYEWKKMKDIKPGEYVAVKAWENLCFVCPNHYRKIEFVKVREKFYEGVEDTYDMEVAKNHNFLAGGFIVHNSGITRDYIERKNGEQKIEKVNPIYDKITEDTQGLIVFQEQVMKIFSDMANRNAIEVHRMREKVAKSHGLQSMQDEKKGFIEGCKENDIGEEFAEELFQKIAHFGSYAFNKSHAIVYTQIAYWTQWLKTFYPLEFYVSSLNNENNDDKVRRLLGALEKKGYKLLLPHINKSKEGFTVEKWNGEKAMRFGLRYTKGIGKTTASEIVKHQPYENEEDVKTRKGIKRRTFHKGIRRLLKEVDAWKDDDEYTQEELEGLREFLAAEELLPLPVLGKNIKKARNLAKHYNVNLTDVNDLDFSHNDFVYLCGVFNGVNYARVGDFGPPSKYSKWEVGDRYAMMDLQDGTAHMRVKFNPKKYQEYKDDLRIGQKVLIHSRILKDIKMVFIDFMVVLSEEKIKEHQEKYGEDD